MKDHLASRVAGESFQGDPMNILLVHLLSSSLAPCQHLPKKCLACFFNLLC